MIKLRIDKLRKIWGKEIYEKNMKELIRENKQDMPSNR